MEWQNRNCNSQAYNKVERRPTTVIETRWSDLTSKRNKAGDVLLHCIKESMVEDYGDNDAWSTYIYETKPAPVDHRLHHPMCWCSLHGQLLYIVSTTRKNTHSI